MNFWENVERIREYRDIPRKELAYRADFSLNSISTGIARNSVPLADVACRIADVLGVSVEFLVTGKPEKSAKNEIRMAEARIEQNLDKKRDALLRQMEKYPEMMEAFSTLSRPMQKAISDLIRTSAEDRK